MDKPTCSRSGCSGTVLAKGKCRSHYYADRNSAIRAEARNVPRTCQVCAADISGTDPRRVYCSTKCKDKGQGDARQARLVAARPSRRCVNCDVILPTTKHGQAIVCSKACGIKYQNRQRTLKEKAARWARVEPCSVCSGVIPPERTARAKTCSEECSRARNTAGWKGRQQGYMRDYRYGITPEQYDAMWSAQGECCAICKGTEHRGVSWHTDHDHVTGKVRGILCGPCNNALGLFKDDPVRIQAAVEYLTTM